MPIKHAKRKAPYRKYLSILAESQNKPAEMTKKSRNIPIMKTKKSDFLDLLNRAIGLDK